VSKVLILITAPTELESNVNEDSAAQEQAEPFVPDADYENSGQDSDNKMMAFFTEVDPENCSSVCNIENGVTPGQQMPNVELNVGDGDIDNTERPSAEEMAKADSSNRAKVKIQNSPSSSSAAHKKHCGTGCCIVS
jgi:hypothetical protein